MKRLALFLALLMCFTVFAVACKKGSGNAGGTDTTPVGEDDERLDLPKEKFEAGTKFVVLSGNSSVYTMWDNIDITPVETSDSQISTAVAKRNSLVESRLGVTIESDIDFRDVAALVRRFYDSGDFDYDAHLTQMIYTAPLIAEGALKNLYELPYVNTENPWWDSSAAKDSEILGSLYFANGDININDDNATWGIFVNRDLRTDLELPNRYTDVKNDNWIFDLLIEDCRAAKLDIDGHGVMDENDRYGMCDQYQSISALYNAFGGYAVKTNSDGVPEFIADQPAMIEKLSRAQEFMFNTDIQSPADKYRKAGDGMYHWNLNFDIFAAGRALYLMTPVCSLFQPDSLRSLEMDYGVLPLPKYDANQKDYYNTYQADNVTVYSVPWQSPYTEKIGAVLEAMAYYSTDTVRRAYFDYCLEQKGAGGDEENIEMLNLIFDTRVNDLGFCYNWAEMKQIFNDLSASGSPTNVFALKGDVIRGQIDIFMEAIADDNEE